MAKPINQSPEELLKKIKALKEELEDALDDIDSLKKKTEEIKKERSALQDSLHTEERKGKQREEEKQRTLQALDDLKRQKALNDEALAFVQEILTAKPTSNQSVEKLNQAVDAIVDYISEVRDVYKLIYKMEADYEDHMFGFGKYMWATAVKKSWIYGKTTIAFVGEFSAGKTTIVNRILSNDNPNVPQLPVSTKATTAIPTYISGGLVTDFQFVTPEGETKQLKESTFKRVNKEVLEQVKGVSSLIQYFVMTYKNPNLNKLSILDTPGFNSNDPEDAERTIEVINECDALFWVFDVNAGTINRSSIATIKENLNKPLYIVINQIDTKSKSDVDKVSLLISNTLKNEGIPVQGIIRFSKKEPLETIMKVIRSIQHDTSREGYLEELITEVASDVQTHTTTSKESLKQCNELENQYDNLSDAFDEALEALRNECEYVRSIPQFDEGIFIDDYRMDLADYELFKMSLDNIAIEHCNHLVNISNDLDSTASSKQTAWQNHATNIEHKAQLEKCLETLKKKKAALDKILNPQAVTTPKQSQGDKFSSNKRG